MFLKGKCALVTGSTSGIGLAYARALATEGANIVLNGFGDADQIAALCEELAASSGGRAIFAAGDLTKREGTEAMVATALAEFGAVDILINNAGMQHVAPVEDFPVEKWDAIIALNLTSAFDACRLCIPGMKADRKSTRLNSSHIQKSRMPSSA